MHLTTYDIIYVGFVIEWFFLGLYSGIFFIYLHYQHSQQDTNREKNYLFYALWVLYALIVVMCILDTSLFLLEGMGLRVLYPLDVIDNLIFGCCDVIAQSILIYRCWIVWGCKIKVVIIPSFLTFAFFVMWIVGVSSSHIVQDQVDFPNWSITMSYVAFAITMVVNALVTGLIVLRIFRVCREVKACTRDDPILKSGTTGRPLQHAMFVLIESGMALFSIQLARFVLNFVSTDAAVKAYQIIPRIHGILNGITPTIILVRVSMGLSFHDEDSMVQASVDFVTPKRKSNPISEMDIGNISVERDRKDNDGIWTQSSLDGSDMQIEMNPLGQSQQHEYYIQKQ